MLCTYCRPGLTTPCKDLEDSLAYGRYSRNLRSKVQTCQLNLREMIPYGIAMRIIAFQANRGTICLVRSALV